MHYLRQSKGSHMKKSWRKFANTDVIKQDAENFELDNKYSNYNESRPGLMRKIGCMLEWAFDHGVDFTSILRKAYPQYEWSWLEVDYEMPDEKKIVKILQTHDFIWHYQRILLMARSRRRKTQFFSWCCIDNLNKDDGTSEIIRAHCTVIYTWDIEWHHYRY